MKYSVAKNVFPYLKNKKRNTVRLAITNLAESMKKVRCIEEEFKHALSSNNLRILSCSNVNGTVIGGMSDVYFYLITKHEKQANGSVLPEGKISLLRD